MLDLDAAFIFMSFFCYLIFATIALILKVSVDNYQLHLPFAITLFVARGLY